MVVVSVCGCAASRASAAEIERIAEIMGLEKGMHIADVGAGDGEWAVELAELVGRSGRIWATEVEKDDVKAIQQRIERLGLENVTVVLGRQDETGLPDGCCDAILLRMVYHHFEEPARMRASLVRALKPAGTVTIIDISPQSSWRELADVPDRGGHGITAEELIREMTADGFEVLRRRDAWNEDQDRYCVVFQRPAAADRW